MSDAPDLLQRITNAQESAKVMFGRQL